MNASDTTPAVAPENLAAVQKKLFRVTVKTDPAVLGKSPTKFVNIQLAPGGSLDAYAVLNNFSFSGGTITVHSAINGASGDFTSSITMQCRSGRTPQVIGEFSKTLTQFSFTLALSTNCSNNNWFTMALVDLHGNSFPTTAGIGQAGLIACVKWNTLKQFTAAGYQGNGPIDGQSDSGFSATVVAL